MRMHYLDEVPGRAGNVAAARHADVVIPLPRCHPAGRGRLSLYRPDHILRALG